MTTKELFVSYSDALNTGDLDKVFDLFSRMNEFLPWVDVPL